MFQSKSCMIKGVNVLKKARVVLTGLAIATTTFVTSLASATPNESVEQVIQKHLQQQGLNYQVGSPEWDSYLHDVTWAEDKSLLKNPRYKEILHYANVYEQRKVDPAFKDEPKPVVGIQEPKKGQSDKPTLAFTSISYNRQQVVNYAYKWAVEKGYSRNRAYRDFTQTDCTNFVSQAWVAGGDVMRYPSPKNVGLLSTTSYWYGEGADQSYNYYYSSSWVLAPDYLTYWNTTRGQTVYTWSAANRTDIINWAIPGDVLQVSDSSGVVVHSMIVSKVDTGHVYLTYHSGAGGLDRVDRPLSDIDISSYDRYYLIRFE